MKPDIAKVVGECRKYFYSIVMLKATLNPDLSIPYYMAFLHCLPAGLKLFMNS
jgi:hypothetical protein